MHLEDLRSAHLRYWRDTLVEAALRSLDVDPEDASSQQPLEQLAEGKILDEIRIEQLFKAYAARRKEEDAGDLTKAPVTVCLLAYQAARKDRAVQYGCIWLPGEIDRHGLLSPVSSGPWIARSALSPTDTIGPTLGDYDAWEKFVDTTAYKATSWSDAIDHVTAFLRAISPAAPRIERDAASAEEMGAHLRLAEVLPEIEGFERLRFGLLLPAASEAPDVVRPITNTYDVLLEGVTEAPLIENALSAITGAADTPKPRPVPDARHTGAKHLGQMAPGQPLTPRQRDTVHAFIELEESEILAVNGPPGTGKTSLLKSIIATAITTAARNDEPMPVTVVTSTNNQAVTNVIDDLAGAVPSDGGTLLKRWLPKIETYGYFDPSQNRLKEAQDRRYPLLSSIKPDAQNEQWLSEADDYWGARFLDWAAEEKFAAPIERPDQIELLETLLEAACAAIEHAPRQWIPPVEAGSETALAPLRQTATEQTEVARKLEETIAIAEEKTREQSAISDQLKAGFRTKEIAWLSSVPAPSLIEMVLWFLPPVAGARAGKLAVLAAAAGFDIPLNRQWKNEQSVKNAVSALITLGTAQPSAGSTTEPLAETRRRLREAIDAREAAVAEIERRIADRQNAIDELRQRGLTKAQAEHIDADSYPLFEALDQLRARAFALAMRLMEGRMIRDRLEQKASKLSNGPQSAKATWRVMAVFAPCIVMTVHKLVKTFVTRAPVRGGNKKKTDFTDEFVPGLIDTLLIDEAGQVGPAMAIPALAFARKCLMVGDIHQLEPITTSTAKMDRLSAARHNINERAYIELERRGGAAVSGSAMALARSVTAISEADERGIMLVDHFRSVPEVIQYCNALVYRGRLRPRRASLPEASRVQLADGPLNPMSYAHVATPVELRSGSWSNPGEAATIATWLKANAGAISTAYGGAPLHELVAIVTPFDGQRTTVREVVERALGRHVARKMTIDTIHSLQGAQRRIVIMSPTVTTKWKLDRGRQAFFDRGPNMMNVVVSRAQDAFLVFGDMYLFSEDGGRSPSSALAPLLFGDPSQRLEVEPGLAHVERSEIERISDLEGHRNELAAAFRESQAALTIVSPQISAHAIREDGLIDAVRAAKSRDIQVLVYTDDQLDVRQDGLKDVARRGRDELALAGARVIVVKRLHAKTLISDDAVIVEGSFNWLSATRDQSSDWHRLESSLRYSGSRVSELSRNARSTLESLQGKVWQISSAQLAS